MGRNAGWITASTVLAKEDEEDDAPHLIYLPEVPFREDKFLSDVDNVHRRLSRVVIAVCEGLKDENGQYITSSNRKVDTDGFGHRQLGGVGDYLCDLIATRLNIKARFDKPGTIQRVSMMCASRVDVREAYMVGVQAVRLAAKGYSGYMVTLDREPGAGYKCHVGMTELSNVANKEKKVPAEFIVEDGNFVNDKFINYARPLIGGPLPEYVHLKKTRI
jgi:6-phosphofructokinase 1